GFRTGPAQAQPGVGPAERGTARRRHRFHRPAHRGRTHHDHRRGGTRNRDLLVQTRSQKDHRNRRRSDSPAGLDARRRLTGRRTDREGYVAQTELREAFFTRSGGELLPTDHARSWWTSGMIHGRLLGGLAARALEAEHGAEGLHFTRLTV